MSKKGKTNLSRKEKKEKQIQKWAFGILFALVIEFLVYILVLNLVPTMVKTTLETDAQQDEAMRNASTILDGEGNKAALVNSFYRTDRCYVSGGYFSNDMSNPTWWMYYYQMVLLSLSIVLVLYYLVMKMEEGSRKGEHPILSFLKREWPFTVLLAFMIWVFLSSCLAGDSYRSFVGCYNLKDGYFSFLMYGSMLVCSFLILKYQ